MKANYRIITSDGKIKYAGTAQPSWLTLIQAAILVNYFEEETIYEFDSDGRKLWEVSPGYPVFIDEYTQGEFKVWVHPYDVYIYNVWDTQEPALNEVLFIEKEKRIVWGRGIDLFSSSSYDFNMPYTLNGKLWDGDFGEILSEAIALGFVEFEMDFIPCIGTDF